MLCVINDITERVRMDKQIARLGQLNLIGEMAAGIAHEIRNPMTTVRGFLQLSKTGVNREFADIMIQELDRANAIITEFLSLAKNTYSNQKPQQLNGIIEYLFPLMEAEAVLMDKRVELELGDCPELMLDEKEIRQLVLNMVNNGLDAMEPGGVVTLRTYAEPNAGVLEIIDQGSGIPDDILDKIGTPFFTTKDSGTGLGLAVCYSIANRHKAMIDVRTGKGGTTFTIRFPQRRDESTNLGG
ncbi:ATP-binding protein [Gordoniibacillus kamchatkensis]|uniref:ATP-binding protein n=1 Tax=Gordoniibacillus kamchatkensis TaxID=1590651 RepID=UPI000698CE4B|nr:ATP-binding protein [Paenibacillus sp. VKM B-2647]